MLKTVKAEIDAAGNVRLLEKVTLGEPHLALVTILDEAAPMQATVKNKRTAKAPVKADLSVFDRFAGRYTPPFNRDETNER